MIMERSSVLILLTVKTVQNIVHLVLFNGDFLSPPSTDNNRVKSGAFRIGLNDGSNAGEIDDDVFHVFIKDLVLSSATSSQLEVFPMSQTLITPEVLLVKASSDDDRNVKFRVRTPPTLGRILIVKDNNKQGGAGTDGGRSVHPVR